MYANIWLFFLCASILNSICHFIIHSVSQCSSGIPYTKSILRLMLFSRLSVNMWDNKDIDRIAMVTSCEMTTYSNPLFLIFNQVLIHVKNSPFIHQQLSFKSFWKHKFSVSASPRKQWGHSTETAKDLSPLNLLLAQSTVCWLHVFPWMLVAVSASLCCFEII